MIKFRKTVAAVLVLIVFCTGAVRANAAVIEQGESIQPCRITIHPITGDQYTDARFTTLTAAKNYFGWGWNYQPCNVTYLGDSYNYFYYFSDATKQFFNVMYSDEDIILGIPGEKEEQQSAITDNTME